MNRILKNFSPYTIKLDNKDYNLSIAIKDPTAEFWYGKKWDNLKEVNFLKKYSLKWGAKILNLGAHQGVVAMILAKEVGEQGRVLAVEANKHDYEVMKENIALNSLNQVEPLYLAVGLTDGEVDFSKDGNINHSKDTNQIVKVKSKTVDSLSNDYFLPDLVFMDIEGFEVQALKSATQTISSQVDWFIEVHQPEYLERFGGSLKDILSLFSKKDFDLFIGSDKEDFKPFDEKSPLLYQRFFLIAISKKRN